MSIKVGVCGTGSFANCFIPLFKAHPEVREVVLCDLDAKKLKEKSELFGIPATCPSLDELCQTDVDAIAIITQHHLHGPQAIQALKAGKHVYSAVPSAISMQEIAQLVQTVKATGRIYMIGETSYYYPCAIYCRMRFNKGDFGHIVYAEGEYYHDYVHGGYDVAKWRFGKDWEQYYGIPPMFYPTHSTSMIVSVTGAHATHVSGMGFVDRHPDNLYARVDNVWKNPFSNETMLCRMSDGSMARISEFRRIGHPGTVGMSLYGTEASYEEQVGSQMWVTKDLATCIDLVDRLKCKSIPAGGDAGNMSKVTSADGTHLGVSYVHSVKLLPKEFRGLPNGHNGSHQFMVHDFVTACVTGKTPPNNVWAAARYLVPGLIAHESAKQGGVLLEVPDFGDPPAGSTLLWNDSAEPEWYAALIHNCTQAQITCAQAQIITGEISSLQPAVAIAKTTLPGPKTKFTPAPYLKESKLMDIRPAHGGKDGIVYLRCKVRSPQARKTLLLFGVDGPAKVWVNGKKAGMAPTATNPAIAGQYHAKIQLRKGINEIVFAVASNHGRAWGVIARIEPAYPDGIRGRELRTMFKAYGP